MLLADVFWCESRQLAAWSNCDFVIRSVLCLSRGSPTAPLRSLSLATLRLLTRSPLASLAERVERRFAHTTVQVPKSEIFYVVSDTAFNRSVSRSLQASSDMIPGR